MVRGMRAVARVLMAAYKRRLRAIVKVAPARVSEENLSTSEHIGDNARCYGWARTEQQCCGSKGRRPLA